jgi:SWI/SNF-related matrix-associated actin-dependent regulator of chromatin subfamily A3
VCITCAGSDNHRIPFVRFDGQMSAKRRQEAIARFSVPLEGVGRLQAIENSAPRRPSRKTRKANFVESTASGEDSDSDFVMDNGLEDDFDDGLGSSSMPKRNKSKGKSKASQTNFQEFESSDGNPRVMLLSLKAVRWIVGALVNSADNSF